MLEILGLVNKNKDKKVLVIELYNKKLKKNKKIRSQNWIKLIIRDKDIDDLLKNKEVIIALFYIGCNIMMILFMII